VFIFKQLCARAACKYPAKRQKSSYLQTSINSSSPKAYEKIEFAAKRLKVLKEIWVGSSLSGTPVPGNLHERLAIFPLDLLMKNRYSRFVELDKLNCHQAAFFSAEFSHARCNVS
jgi:hypothetical protein